MSDRFDEMARQFYVGGFATSKEDRLASWDAIATALRAQYRAGQEAMRERAAKQCDECDAAMYSGKPNQLNDVSHAAAIRKLPIEES